MRILIATSHRNLVGGTEKYLQALLPGLRRCGHEVGLVYEYPFDTALEAIDAPGLSLTARCVRELGLQNTLAFVKEWNPEAIYSHGLQATELESALVEAYPTVLYVHNYHGTCVSERKCFATPRLEPCSRRFGPACLGLYYPRRCGGLDPTTMWRMYRQQSERNGLLQRYSAVLVASRHMFDELHQHGVNDRKLHLVPLPTTDTIADAPPPALRAPRGRILFVGRLTDVKGVQHLIRAVPGASERLGQPLELTIAGDGPERERLERLARHLNVAARFTGWVHTERKIDLMRETDLLAVPSLWPEPFGLVGVEAGCLGVPAVGFAVGGIPDWLIPAESGEIAPGHPPTVPGLRDAIVRALVSPDHYSTLCRGAWQIARQFTLERHLSKLEPILSGGPALSFAGALRSNAESEPSGDSLH